MKCDVCGTESDFAAAFIKKRRAFRKTYRILCPGCWSRRYKVQAVLIQIPPFVAGIVGYFLIWQNIWPDVGESLTTLFLLNLSLILSILPHELGHAMMVRLLGWRLFAVVIGMGKRLFKFHFSNVIFSFHWLPVGGFTQFASLDTRHYKIKYFLIILAGPMVNAFIAITILFVSRWKGGVPHPVQLYMIANFFILITISGPAI